MIRKPISLETAKLLGCAFRVQINGYTYRLVRQGDGLYRIEMCSHGSPWRGYDFDTYTDLQLGQIFSGETLFVIVPDDEDPEP